jgi:methionine-rich copper-binding protein CopC
MPYTTAATILAHAQVTSPTAAETAVATAVSAAIEARITRALGDTVPDTDGDAELTRAALDDGAAAYARARTGQRDELGSDIAVALVPVLFALTEPAIG